MKLIIFGAMKLAYQQLELSAWAKMITFGYLDTQAPVVLVRKFIMIFTQNWEMKTLI